jgi:hypothetical protein
VNLDPIEAEVFGWLLEATDSPRSLSEGIERDFGPSMPLESVSNALRRLVASGFAQAFEFDDPSRSYRPVAMRNPPLGLWFMATRAGRDIVERLP